MRFSSSCAESVEISSPSTIAGGFLRGSSSSIGAAPCLHLLWQAMKAIAIENPGRDYRLVPVDVPKPMPGAGEMLIKVAAAGLNNADLLQARGAYPPPPGASPIL